MKYTIRRNTFETNSSSVHSLVYRNQELEPPDLPINKETNKVKAYYGEFGKDYNVYYDQSSKLSYLLTCIYYHYYNDEEIENSYAFEILQDIVREYCGVDGIEICGGEPYIDHQSYPDDMFGIVGYSDEAIRNFLFNGDIGLKTESD